MGLTLEQRIARLEALVGLDRGDGEPEADPHILRAQRRRLLALARARKPVGRGKGKVSDPRIRERLQRVATLTEPDP